MITPSGSDSVPALASSSAAKLPVTLDTKGRVRTSKEQRRRILAEFERSGMSAAQFARRAGLKYSTFAFWVQRYRRTKRPARRSPLRLLEAVVDAAPPHPSLQPAKDQPRRAVNAVNRGDSIVQAAAMLPVVTWEAVPRLPRSGAAGRAGLLEDEFCPEAKMLWMLKSESDG